MKTKQLKETKMLTFDLKTGGRSYRLPDGGLTTDIKNCRRAWTRLISPLEKLLHLRCEAFDPDMRFTDEQTSGRESVRIPVWLARRVLSVIKLANKRPSGIRPPDGWNRSDWADNW